MDEKQMQELLNAMVQIAEIVTAYHKALIKAGMDKQNALKLTAEYQRGLMFGSAENKQNSNPIMKGFGVNN